MKKLIIIVLAIIANQINAQEYLANPSFEDTPGSQHTPTGWTACYLSSSPDTQPGFFGVSLSPSDGGSYLGLVSRGYREDPDKSYRVEACGAELLTPILEGFCYTFNLDMYFEPNMVDNSGYAFNAPVKLTVYGGNSACNNHQVLFVTDVIDNTIWETYTYQSYPAETDYTYILFEVTCNASDNYDGNVMIDNMSIEESYPWSGQYLLDTIITFYEGLQIDAPESDSYYWEPSDYLSCDDCQSPIVFLTDEAAEEIENNIVYNANLINSTDGCRYVEKYNIELPDCKLFYPHEEYVMLDTTLGFGDTIRLHASESIMYQWDTTNVLLDCDTCQNPLATVYQSQVFAVTLRGVYNCPYIEKFIIEVPCGQNIVNTMLETTANYEDTLLLRASESPSYQWETNDALSCLDCRNPIAIVTESEVFVVELKDEENCPYKEKFIVEVPDCDTVYPEDYYEVLDTTVEAGSTISLSSSESRVYKWEPNASLSCFDCQNPLASVYQPEIFKVELRGDYNCPYSEYFILRIENNGNSNIGKNIFIPNVITPNNDGINEYFEIKGLGEELDLTIYNRYGKIVYQNKNYDQSWDGKDMDNNPLNEDTYWYVVIASDIIVEKGYVYVKYR